MTRALLSDMKVGLKRVAADMLHENFSGVSQKMHDADEYHVRRVCGGNVEKLSEVICEAVEQVGIDDINEYYIVHLYDTSCALILPHKFSEEEAEIFVKVLNSQADKSELSECFVRQGPLKNSYFFKDYWPYTQKALEEIRGALKNSFFFFG